MTIQQHASFDSSAAELNATSKLVKAWESKNAKNAAKVGGISMMALSLAACGGSSTTTTATTTGSTTTTTTTTTTAVVSSALSVSNDTVAGSTGNDTVTGARIDTVQTFNSGDSITLGAGTDSFSATLNAGTVTPAALTGAENVTFTALGAATVDFDNATDVTSITSLSSSATLTVDDIQALTTSVTVSNNTAAQTFVFKDAALTATTDSLILNLDGAGAVVNIGGEADADGDIETMVINATGGASDLGAGNGFGADATSITVAATAALDLGSSASFANATTFDASTSTAGVTAVFADRAAASETAVAWSGGAGADSFDVSAVTLANFGDIVIDLGAGADTLTIGSKHDTDTGSQFTGGAGEDTVNVAATSITSAAFAANLTGFEVLQFVMAGNQAQDMDLAAGMNIVSVSDAAVTDDLTISDAADGLVIRLDGALLSANDAGITTADDDIADVKVTLKTDTANDDVTLQIGGTLGDVNMISLDPGTTYETVNVVSSGASANAIQTIGTAINNMTFSGSTALSVLGLGSMTGVADASAMTGAFTTTTAAGVAITVTGGSGADVLTFGAADNVAQTLNGGAGNDTLASGAVIGETTGITYTMNGGAGNDTISTTNAVGDTSADGLDAIFNITGGSGIDIVTLDTDADISHDIITSESLTANLVQVASGFESGAAAGDDDIDYNGTLLNDTATTVVGSTATTLAGALSGDVDATVYIDSGDLTGSAASTLTTLADATTTATITSGASAFIDALVALEGTVTGLDTTISTGETVLMAFDNGTDSVLVKFTNSDTSVANTMTAAEIEVVAVVDGTVLVAADII